MKPLKPSSKIFPHLWQSVLISSQKEKPHTDITYYMRKKKIQYSLHLESKISY